MTKLFEPGQLVAPADIERIGEQVCQIGNPGGIAVTEFREWCWITRRHPENVYPGAEFAFGVKHPYGTIYDPVTGEELGGIARVTGVVIVVKERCAMVEFDDPEPSGHYAQPRQMIEATTWAVPIMPVMRPINSAEPERYTRRPSLFDVFSGRVRVSK